MPAKARGAQMTRMPSSTFRVFAFFKQGSKIRPKAQPTISESARVSSLIYIFNRGAPSPHRYTRRSHDNKAIAPAKRAMLLLLFELRSSVNKISGQII